MNILLINHYAGSPKYGMEFRPYYLAKYWQSFGHKVKIIAASYSHLRNENYSVKKGITLEQHDDLNYVWIKTPEYEGNGLKRVLNIFAFLIRLFLNRKKVIYDFKPDLIITSSTYPLDSILGAYFKRRYRGIHFHEVHDLWPLTLKEIGGFSSYHPFIVLLQIAENFAYRKSDAVISMLPNAKSYMMKHGLKSSNFFHIPNGYDEKEWSNQKAIPPDHLNLLTKLKNEKKFIVLYAGGHALSNALDQLILCALNLKDNSKIAFVLVGKGIEKENLINKVTQLQLENVFFLPSVTKDKISNLLSFADLLYIGWHYSALYEHGISPNKLIDYMLAGKPILHAICFSHDIVEQIGCGLSVPSNNLIEISNAILKISAIDNEHRLEMGERGKKFAQKNYNYEILAKNFLEVYKKYRTT